MNSTPVKRVAIVEDVKEIGEPPLFVEINPKLVKQVILGCRMESQPKDKLMSILSEPEWRHVVLKESVMHKGRYKVNYELVRSID